MFDLHYWPTPNGKKVTILLEECGLEYKIVPCNIQRGDQFTPEFLKMNPNHRMPVMVDHEPKGGGAPISVFESGAIMMYIAEKVGRFWPQDLLSVDCQLEGAGAGHRGIQIFQTLVGGARRAAGGQARHGGWHRSATGSGEPHRRGPRPHPQDHVQPAGDPGTRVRALAGR